LNCDASAIRLRNLSRRYTTPGGAAFTAVEDIKLDVAAGTFVSIVGPSGCGKTTILNIIAGLLEPSDGLVEIFGQPLVGINRRAAYVFQQDALLPWKTLTDNIALGPQLRGLAIQEARERALEWVGRVGLSEFANHFPDQLSGGMRKRAALAQAWIVKPDLMLMDEPFGALDVHTRLRMEAEILSLWRRNRETIVFVTHDLEEAISLSDQVVVMSAGPGSQVVGVYCIDLPRPRNLIDMKTEPHFIELYRTIWKALKGEVLKSYGPISEA
jgi:NitT/TauT family transport system ATP-binding protein